MLLCVTCTIVLSSCSKEEGEDFNYPMSSLYGTWDGTAINTGDGWWDITGFLYYEYQYSISFYEGGRYYGRGYFGTGGGTYEASGNVISTYVDGKPYRKYRVKSLNNDRAEVEWFVDGASETIGLRLKKRTQ